MNAPKVLVADDSPLVLHLLEKLLSTAGFDVVTARDGLEAVEKAFTEDVSLVILDVMMPRMNGYQACRLLKSTPATRDVPVAMLTSRDQAADRFWSIETGADHFITKDSEPVKIVALVREILDKQGHERLPRNVEKRDSVDILSQVNELLDRKLYELTILSEISQVARLVHFDETFTSVMGVITRVVDFSLGAFAFVEDDDLQVMLMLRRPLAQAVVEEAKTRLLADVAKRRGGAGFARVHARLFTPSGPEVAAEEELSLEGFACFPVIRNHELAAVLAVASRARSHIGAEAESLLGKVAQHAHIVLENSRLFDRIKNLSMRDSLTELFNHRHSIELLASELQRVGRYDGGIGVLMIDIDHFKAINDLHGHQAGDQVLREISRRLREGLRTVDVLGRYGGEEFLVVLPQTAEADARRTAERLRRSIGETVFHAGAKEFQVSISIGVSAYDSAGADSADAMIREADAALYRAKQGGRNRVE